MEKLNIMLATRDETLKERLTDILAPRYHVRAVADSCRGTLENLMDDQIDLILYDPSVKELDGIELLELIKKMHPQIQIVVITDDDSYETGVKIARAGVYYNMHKPIDDETTKQVVAGVERKLGREERE